MSFVCCNACWNNPSESSAASNCSTRWAWPPMPVTSAASTATSRALRAKLRQVKADARTDPDPSRPRLQLQPGAQLMSLGTPDFLVYVLFIGLTGYFVLNTGDGRNPSRRAPVHRRNPGRHRQPDGRNPARRLQGRHPQLRTAGPSCSRLTANDNRRRESGACRRIRSTTASTSPTPKGIVVLDSSGVAVGQDYSRWNDVYLTLRGEVRRALDRAAIRDDSNSSVMHVGAPIRDNGQIIGVVTVAKPNSSLQPYVDRTERRLLPVGRRLDRPRSAVWRAVVVVAERGAAAADRLMPRPSAKADGSRCRTIAAANWNNWLRRWSRCARNSRARPTSSVTCTH